MRYYDVRLYVTTILFKYADTIFCATAIGVAVFAKRCKNTYVPVKQYVFEMCLN
jgi:hypothetical protein